MTSDIRKCEVCGKSYEEARRSLNEVLRSNIIIPKISELQSEKYRESLQKLLAEVKNAKEGIVKEGLSNVSLIDLPSGYGSYLDSNSTLYKFIRENRDDYISENELIWFEDYVNQVCNNIPVNEALQSMQTWLETEIKERLGDPGGFSKSVDEAIEEASDKYSMHTNTASLEIDRKEKLPLLLYKWPGSDFNNVAGYPGSFNVRRSLGFFERPGVKIRKAKAINICWICSSLFNDASNEAYKVD